MRIINLKGEKKIFVEPTSTWGQFLPNLNFHLRVGLVQSKGHLTIGTHHTLYTGILISSMKVIVSHTHTKETPISPLDIRYSLVVVPRVLS